MILYSKVYIYETTLKRLFFNLLSLWVPLVWCLLVPPKGFALPDNTINEIYRIIKLCTLPHNFLFFLFLLEMEVNLYLYGTVMSVSHYNYVHEFIRVFMHI